MIGRNLIRSLDRELPDEVPTKTVSSPLYRPRRDAAGTGDGVIVDVNVFDRMLGFDSDVHFSMGESERQNYIQTWGRESFATYQNIYHEFRDSVSPIENLEIIRRIESRDIDIYCPEHAEDCIKAIAREEEREASAAVEDVLDFMENDMEQLEVMDKMGLEDNYKKRKAEMIEDRAIASKTRSLPGFTPIITYDADFLGFDEVLALAPRSLNEMVKPETPNYGGD